MDLKVARCTPRNIRNHMPSAAVKIVNIVKVVEADHCPDELEFMNALKGMTELKVVRLAGDGKCGGG